MQKWRRQSGKGSWSKKMPIKDTQKMTGESVQIDFAKWDRKKPASHGQQMAKMGNNGEFFFRHQNEDTIVKTKLRGS
jgi:hypothetical protein